ncbi:MAG: hypothetical protein K6G33_07950 [Ruminococcus sp.]|uniref:hypothetical protein n=1 Tax=Ruminococcus sp. TaxID=41978 RepID=UPI0025D5FF99|nr:hypothetical protein [Ruminococcus sp.]MCR5600656.1 hypothetical protein [Ruminococcus sp.]
MKHSKIKNIFSAVKPNTKGEVNKTSDDGYIEVVSGTETIKRSSSMLRMVSAVAACAVLAGGIGTTGFLMHRQSKNKPTSEIDNVVATTTAASETLCPFGDFTARDFVFMNDDENCGCYSKEAYTKIAEYLNTFNWGEKIETNEKNPNTQSPCAIYWDDEINDRHVIDIYDDGMVFYTVYREHSDGNEDIFEKGVYKIDFNKFDSELKEILETYVYSKNISEQDITNLVEVNLESVKLFDGNGYEIVPVNENSKAELAEFLRGDFLRMLQPSKPGLLTGDPSVYSVEQIFNVDENTKRRQTYYISENGHVSRCEYKTDENGEWQPADCQNYYIDYNKFDVKIVEFLENCNTEKVTESKEEEKPQATTTTTIDERGQDMSHIPPVDYNHDNMQAYDDDNIYYSTTTGLYVLDSNDNIIASGKTHDMAKLKSAIVDKLDSAIKSNVECDAFSDNNSISCSVLWKYRDTDGKLKYSNYIIYENGHVVVYYYEYGTYHDGEVMNWLPNGFDGTVVNNEEFKSEFNECLKNAAL